MSNQVILPIPTEQAIFGLWRSLIFDKESNKVTKPNIFVRIYCLVLEIFQFLYQFWWLPGRPWLCQVDRLLYKKRSQNVNKGATTQKNSSNFSSSFELLKDICHQREWYHDDQRENSVNSRYHKSKLMKVAPIASIQLSSKKSRLGCRRFSGDKCVGKSYRMDYLALLRPRQDWQS